MSDPLLMSTELSRRRFVLNAARACLGLSILEPLAPRLRAAPFEGASKLRQTATAKRVIYLYMTGGMSHLDTFGAVPGASTMGSTRTIKTSADGVEIGEYLPQTARYMHHGVILNSLTSTQGAHVQGNYFMHTSYTLRGGTRHPSMGAWLTKLQGRSNPTLPGSAIITGDSRHPGGGFLEADAQPLVLGDPSAGLQYSERPTAITGSDLDYRLHLSAQLDDAFQSSYRYANLKAHADVYREAVKVMNSADLVAFDITKEDPATRERYGSDHFGQGCLLARRLIEHGVRFVEVTHNGWDTHQDNFTRLPDLCAVLDRGLGALLPDLESRGLLKDTLVVLTTEFGRTPKINEKQGRDHYPKAFSSVLWGGGVRGGQVYGRTDRGIEVTGNKISVPDFNATLAYALGLPLDAVTYSPNNRPFTVAGTGQPVTGIF